MQCRAGLLPGTAGGLEEASQKRPEIMLEPRFNGEGILGDLTMSFSVLLGDLISALLWGLG